MAGNHLGNRGAVRRVGSELGPLSRGGTFCSRRFFADAPVFPGVDLAQQFWTRPDNTAIAIHDERNKGGHGLPQPCGACHGALAVRMSLGPHENAADGRRSFQRYWIAGMAGIEQRHGAELRQLLPETQQFLTGQFHRKRYRPGLTFPILNGAPTEAEFFPRDRLRISQFLPPLLEAPNVPRVILEPQQRKMTLAGQANASAAYFGVSNHDFAANRLPVTRSR